MYHNYKIKNSSDEYGNKLNFRQDGDYFEVEKPKNRDIEYIIVEYSGFSEAFYLNRKAVFLPGLFAIIRNLDSTVSLQYMVVTIFHQGTTKQSLRLI